MLRLMTYTRALTCALVLSIASPLALADDLDKSDFSSRELLIETWLGDASLTLEEAEAAVEDAEAALDAAVLADPDDTADEDAALKDAIEVRDVLILAGELSDEQVFDINRAFNNARHNGLELILSAADLQKILDGSYNAQQINAWTKALEEEAKFTALADKAEARGNTDQAARFETKADSQKTKFMDKVSGFAESNDVGEELDAVGTADAVTEAAEAHAKHEAKDAVKDTARGLAKNAAKKTAKAEARLIAKDAAKKAAKAEARLIARDEARNISKELAKENLKAVARGRNK